MFVELPGVVVTSRSTSRGVALNFKSLVKVVDVFSRVSNRPELDLLKRAYVHAGDYWKRMRCLYKRFTYGPNEQLTIAHLIDEYEFRVTRISAYEFKIKLI